MIQELGLLFIGMFTQRLSSLAWSRTLLSILWLLVYSPRVCLQHVDSRWESGLSARHTHRLNMLLVNNTHLEVPELITPVVSNLGDHGALTVHSEMPLCCWHSGRPTLSDVLGWSWCCRFCPVLSCSVTEPHPQALGISAYNHVTTTAFKMQRNSLQIHLCSILVQSPMVTTDLAPVSVALAFSRVPFTWTKQFTSFSCCYLRFIHAVVGIIVWLCYGVIFHFLHVLIVTDICIVSTVLGKYLEV